MFYLNTIEQLFLFVEQLDQLEVCLPYSRLLAGIPFFYERFLVRTFIAKILNKDFSFYYTNTGGIPKFKVEFK